MSSQSWFQHMQKAFPEWYVEDHAGNNFSVMKDVAAKDGTMIAACIYENGACVFGDSYRNFGYANLDTYIRMDEEVGRDGRDIGSETILDGDKAHSIAYDLFCPETVEHLETLQRKFIEEYWNYPKGVYSKGERL
jgi:hypothetical protein